MDLRNCKKCGRVFAYIASEVCSRCANSDEDDFKKVKEYLYDNPGATIVEVSEETGVDEKKILRYLRESRIEIREEDNLLLDCERCGAPIRSGRFCDPCIISMKKEFTAVLKPKAEQPKIRDLGKQDTKMYTAEIRKKFK
ncbi:MerR family transcriptional regulator [Alkaliphilus sp. MSJ-5]|uniref:MerR family transcriptional regulator n=1 Tax=Alkaliphilus flagellatus TaxID=2841507 RepID=A0ABS6G2R3_9FIRM|nr:TIGR03826 family flagellar region protein [Alkaliphilus flagellatus]MBU5676653.1 MerR family transcriptional regulator [Alkaliphilus flagellatus]